MDAFPDFIGGTFLAQAKRAAGETAGGSLCEGWWKLQTLGNRILLKCRAFHGDVTLSNLFLVLSFQLNLLEVVICEILNFSYDGLVKIAIKL